MKFKVNAGDMKSAVDKIKGNCRLSKRLKPDGCISISGCTDTNVITLSTVTEDSQSFIEIDVPAEVIESGKELVIAKNLSETFDYFALDNMVTFEKTFDNITTYFRVFKDDSKDACEIQEIVTCKYDYKGFFNQKFDKDSDFVGKLYGCDITENFKFVENSIHTFKDSNLRGVSVSFKPESVQFVCTNGKSLSVCQRSHCSEIDSVNEVIIWGSLIPILRKMVNHGTIITVYKHGSWVMIKFEDTTIISYTPTEYVNWKKCIPTFSLCNMYLTCDDFIKYLKGVKCQTFDIEVRSNEILFVGEKPYDGIIDVSSVPFGGVLNCYHYILDTKKILSLVMSLKETNIKYIKVSFDSLGRSVRFGSCSNETFHMLTVEK